MSPIPARRRADTSELVGGWRTVLAAATGTGLGVSALLTYPAGLFVKGMQAEFGLTRTQFGLAVFGATVAIALAAVPVGRAVDRAGPRRPAAIGAALLAAGFLALAFFTRSPMSFVVAMTLTGLVAAGSSPVAYARAVSLRFSRRRGLALGLMQLGIGVSATLVPPAIGLMIARWGWRGGFAALAVLALAGLLPALAGLPREHHAADAPPDPQAIGEEPFGPNFWMLLAAFGLMAFAFAGLLPNFVPMLIDLGMTPVRAAALAGLIGLSVISTRLLVGWLADFVHAPLLGAASCLVCAAGCLALAFGGVAAAPAGAIALGATMGAEADLIGFLVARYFPLARYGRIYGWQYGGFMVSAGISPLWIGALADRTGGYRLGLFVTAALLLAAMLPFLLLPRTKPHAAAA